MRPQWWEWARLEKGGGGGGGGAGESSCSSSQRETSSPLSYVSFTPFHIFLIHLSILLHPPCFLSFLQPLSLFPRHSPHPHYGRLTQHMFSPLCDGALFIIGLNSKNPYMEQKSIWWVQCLCVDVYDWRATSDYICFIFWSRVLTFVCFRMLGVLRRVFASS